VSGAPAIRLYRPGDEAGIVALFREVFASELAIPTWRWKYLRGVEPAPVVVGEDGGRIVCHYGGIRSTLVADGEETIAYAIVDVMCERLHQGRGIFRRAAKRFFEAFCEGRAALIYGFPGERHRRLGEILLGYRPVAPVHRLSRSLAGPQPHWPAEVLRPAAIPEDWDARWARIEPRFRLVNRRDRETLSWRYVERPDRTYRVLVARDHAALAVVGLEGSSAYLMELVAEPETSAIALARLVVAAELAAAEGGATTLAGWFPAFARESGILLAAGFVGEPADHRVEIRFFERSFDPDWMAGSFYYSLGDYDVH
jgi:hypothetical protein